MNTQGGYTHLAIARDQTGKFAETRLVGQIWNENPFQQAKAYFKDTDPGFIIIIRLEDAVQYTGHVKETTVWVQDE